MPMYRWINIFEYMELSFILKSERNEMCHRAPNVYQKLQDELIDTFGISDDFLQILKNKIKIEQYYYDQIETGRTSNQILIEMLKIENKELETDKSKADLFEGIHVIGKFFPNVPVDPKTISVYDFHNYSKVISNKLKHHK